jgi:hypothetical protein
VKSVTLVGPQPAGSEQVARILAQRGIKRPVALVTAGWQERESEDEALIASFGVPAVNLRLHARSEELFADSLRYAPPEGTNHASKLARDPELSTAYKARQERLRHMQVFYRMRLESADDVAQAIAVRHVDDALLEEEQRVSIDMLKRLDGDHLARCQRLQDEFDARCTPEQRPSIALHRRELAAILEPAGALVIAGGHVASLLNRMRLFGVLDIARHLPIIAWSAGAMVLTDRIVCFHDYPPYGKDIAQVLDSGLGVAPGVVVLPDPSHRVRMDDARGIRRFAERMAPALCLAMDVGAEVTFEGGRIVSGQAFLLSTRGEVDRDWRGGELVGTRPATPSAGGPA